MKTPGAAHPEVSAPSSSALEEEREFLLRSLGDLEAEHAAGDIDDVDYLELKDAYTVRAAAVLRRLDGSDPPGPPGGVAPPRHSRRIGGNAGRPLRAGSRRRVVSGVLFVAVAALAGWALSASSGARMPGQSVSGSAVGAEKIVGLLAQAQKAAAGGDALGALKDCRRILAMDPNQAQALAEEGWVLAQTQQPALQAEGLGDLTRAVAIAPDDATGHLYRGIVLVDLGRSGDAVVDLQWYLDHRPDPQVAPKVEQALAQAIAASGPAPAVTVP